MLSLSLFVLPFVPFFLLVSLKFLLVLKSFNGVSSLFKGCLKGSLRVFTESFKGVSRKFKGCFKEVWRVFQRSFKEISRVFQKSF